MINKSTHSSEITIAVAGPVDAGKSSLIGVLTTGELDNGRGLARNRVLLHNHEIETGRTSSITLNPVKYISTNSNVELFSTKSRKRTDITKIGDIEIEDKYIKHNNEKVVQYIDLAGHEKYLKTTVFGVTGMFPDRGIVVIGANTGITKLTKEHIGILLYLKVPIVIVITKIDLAPQEIYQNLCNKIKKLLSKNTFGKIIYFISASKKSNNETTTYIDNMIHNSEIIPVISISNKDGTNINNLHKIIYNLDQRDKWPKESNGTVVYLDSNFNVPGIGLVVSGTVKGKPINNKQKMYIGPKDGNFYPVTIRSIHNSIRENVDEIRSDVQGCFNIKFVNPKETITRSEIKKGFVLLDSLDNWKQNVVRTFTARVTILHHSTTIKNGYSPVLHCGPIRQAAQIQMVQNEKDHLKSRDSAIVKFRFNQHEEFMEEKMIFFFRDGNTKGVGEVIAL